MLDNNITIFSNQSNHFKALLIAASTHSLFYHLILHQYNRWIVSYILTWETLTAAKITNKETTFLKSKKILNPINTSRANPPLLLRPITTIQTVMPLWFRLTSRQSQGLGQKHFAKRELEYLIQTYRYSSCWTREDHSAWTASFHPLKY